MGVDGEWDFPALCFFFKTSPDYHTVFLSRKLPVCGIKQHDRDYPSTRV
jgi:hypothetical protein